MIAKTLPQPKDAPRRRWRLLPAHFLKNRRGSVAIEFVALAIPFSLLIFAILESCISFAGQQVLANAADSVAREMRTGQIKSSTFTREQLHTRICGELEIIVASGCPGLHVDLRTFDTFSEAAELRIPLKGTAGSYEIDSSEMKFNLGKSATKNMLRVFYAWPVMTDFMRKSMSNLKGGKTLHFATVTWQNEPFDD